MTKRKHTDETGEDKKPFIDNSVLVMVGSILIIGGAIAYMSASMSVYTECTTESIPPGSTLIDLRPPAQYNNKHVGGAVSVPYGCGSCFPDDITSNYETDDTLVLYGSSAIDAAYDLHGMYGYDNLYILTDYTKWVGPDAI